MKSIQIKLFIFGVLAIMCSTCTKKNYCTELINLHVLFLGVQDVDGNDLVKGIEVVGGNASAHWGPEIKSDLYTLTIIYPDLCMYPIPENLPPVQVVESESCFYLVFDVFTSNVNDCPNADMLTYKLKCSYIFGDDSFHEMVTYWKEGNKPTNSHICYRIDLDGKESNEEIVYERNQISITTVTFEVK